MRCAQGVWILMALSIQAVQAGDTLRIVPQLQWPERGVVSANGAFWAAIAPTRVFLIDGKNAGVVRCETLDGARHAAFSADGRYLVACGRNGGFLLDLQSGEIIRSSALRGTLVVFGVDSKTIVLSKPKEPDPDAFIGFGREGRSHAIEVLDLTLASQRMFPSKVPHPLRLTLSPDGATLQISGFHGDPSMHVPRLGRAEELMDLKTGVAKLTIEPPDRNGRVGFFQEEKLPKAENRKLSNQSMESFYWNEAAGLYVVYGGGMPEGGVVKVWDVRDAAFLKTLGKSNAFRPAGFQSAERFLGSAWIDDVNVLASANPHTGKLTVCGSFAEGANPSPDGIHVAVEIPYSGPDTSGEGVEIRDAKGVTILKEKLVSRVAPGYWSSTGRYFLKLANDRKAVHCFDVQTRAARVFTLAESFVKPAGVQDFHLWNYALSPDESLLALSAGTSGHGGVAILNLSSGAVISREEDLGGWASALRFVSNDEIVIATRRVMLHSIRHKKNVWTRDLAHDVAQIGYVPESEFVVCQETFGGASILQLRDGEIVRRTASITRSSRTTSVAQPTLIGTGVYAIELDFESLALRLVHTRSGDTLLTYLALPEDQWIVYAPNGMWSGSERVREYVRFYQGMRRLENAEALRWSDPVGIKNIARVLK